ncbi:MAG TPA: DNA-binding response regulator [Clostridiales bacterium]|nr:DNA-binding response regulator [Clostridiales bacterium]
MFRIAVCDDDNSICAYVEKIIMRCKEKNLLDLDVEVFFSGEELCDFIIKEHGFDMIFLDIELKDMSGIYAANFIRTEIGDRTVQYVYISGKEDYYKELIDTRPMGFILKPIDEKKVIYYILGAMELADEISGQFKYKKSHGALKKSVKEIIYFESVNREIKMVTTGGEETFYGKLSEIYNQVQKYRFLSIHRSYVVNYHHVDSFTYDELIMSNGEYLPISQKKRTEIRRLQAEYEAEGR